MSPEISLATDCALSQQSCLQVFANFKAGDGLQSTYDWLVLLCSMIGSKLFGMGCAATYVLGNNTDYPQLLATWKANGQLGKQPR